MFLAACILASSLSLPNSTISRSPRLAVLVGGVVGYVDFLPAGMPLVTFVQKPRGLVEGHAFKEAGDSGILVSPHAVREHGVVERVVRIVLGGVVLADDGVGGQVEQQPHLPRFEKGRELLPDSAVGNDLPDDEEGPHAQASADALPTRRSPGRWTPGRYFRIFAFGTMSPSASSLPMDARFG